MALISSEIEVKSIAYRFRRSYLSRLSLRCVKGLASGLIVCLILAYLALWQPAYLHYQSLIKEKEDWLTINSTGLLKTKSNHQLGMIPTIDQLPDMIEKCRSTFEKEGVNVVTFNVERFGEKRGTGKGASLDYALVRMQLVGQWNGIVASLKVLEEEQEISIHVQEIVLASQGGEALLQIYFCSRE